MIRKEAVIAILGSPVAYYAALAKVLGGVEAGVFASQFFYWHGKGHDPDGWVYKTQTEIEEETGLTRRNQETARKRLREIGVLEEKYTGMPAKLYYRLNMDALFELMNAWFTSEVLGEERENAAYAEGQAAAIPARGAGPKPPDHAQNPSDTGVIPQDARTRHPRMRESAIQGCTDPPTKDARTRQPRMREADKQGWTDAPSNDGGKRHTSTKTTTETTTQSTAETTTTTTTAPAAPVAAQAGVDVAVSVAVPAVPAWLLDEFEFLLGEGRSANDTDREALAEMAELPEHVIMQALDAARAWLDDETRGPIFSLARWLLGTAKRKREAELTRGNSATSLPPEASPYVEPGYTPPLPGILRSEEVAGRDQWAPAGLNGLTPGGEDEDGAFWASVLHELELRLPMDVFHRWIRPMRLMSREEDVYVIGLGNAQAKDWVENRFAHMLQQLLSSRAGHAVEVRFELPPA